MGGYGRQVNVAVRSKNVQQKPHKFGNYLAYMLKNLPVYTLAAKICPVGVEATLTACIAATNDLSGALAQFLGGWITHMYVWYHRR